MKKIFSVFLTLLTVVVLVGCKPKTYTVTYDSDGGTNVPTATVKKGELVKKPEDPTKEGYVFFVWTTVKGDADKEFSFSTVKINSDITLYATWTEISNSVVTFDSRGGTEVASIAVETGQKIDAVIASPTRANYKFEGWYRTTQAGTWRDPNEVNLNDRVITENVTFYAYWEPINSKTIRYTDGETYKTTLSADTAHINPLTYTDSLQSTLIGYLKGSMFTEEVDWDKAIENGLADFEGDFSKFVDKNGNGGPYLTVALEPKIVMEMADGWPVDADGESYEDDNGNVDIDLAKSVTSKSWTYTIKPGLKFENGDPINADAYEYTFKQYVDPEQKNGRANLVYDSPYLYLLNSKKYMDGLVTWDEVGYEKIGDLEFTITHEAPISLKQAIDMIDSPTLINERAHKASFSTEGNSSYGSPDHPIVSYGPYVVAEWSEKQRWVFNKNFDYLAKKDITYKSLRMEVVAQETQREEMFAKGEINAFGLSANYYSKYANDESALSSPDAYTMGLSFNNNARSDKKEVPSIVGDHDFRMAFFHAIDREEFALEAAAPDVPSLGLLSDLHLSSLDDLTPYNQTEYHLNAIKDLSPETYGYNPDKAVQLFNNAYNKWVSEGNTGPVKLEFLSRKGSTAYELMAAYLKDALESIFGKDKLLIELNELESANYNAAAAGYNYDMAFNGMGGATALPGIFFLYAVYGQLVGPGSSFEPGFDIPNLPLEIDFSVFANVIKPKIGTDAELDWYKDFLNGFTIDGTEDVIPGLDENGIWKGTLIEFADYSSSTIEAAAKYEGKSDVLFTAMGGVEKALLDLMATIPLTATASTTVYNDLHVDWPSYGIYFGWGAQKYRYLTTDPDFASLLK